MKRVTLIIVLFFHYSYSQVTFLINELPENTPKNVTIYISGDFEGWSGGQKTYKLTKKGDKYSITFPKQKGIINFKFTQGSWDTVETDNDGKSIENRTYTFDNNRGKVNIQILNWNNANNKQSTATKNVSIISNTFKIPQLNKERRIWVYLPPNYETSTESYPVLYMHDGQNVFDETTSYAGEWQVDEILNKLYQEKDFKLIVIGIDNGGESRMNEYSPWENLQFGEAQGEAYINFIVETLKPFIDKNYRTLTTNNNTAMMGSSMGGLISHYAGLKYPQIFGKVGAFSPSFWFSNSSYEFASNNSKLKKSKMYFLVGKNEGANMVSNMKKMITLMKSKGFEENNIIKKVAPKGKHNEAFWKNEFEEAILWLFSE